MDQNRNYQSPESESAKQRAVFHEEDLDEILEKLKSGTIGIESDAEASGETEEDDTAKQRKRNEAKREQRKTPGKKSPSA